VEKHGHDKEIAAVFVASNGVIAEGDQIVRSFFVVLTPLSSNVRSLLQRFWLNALALPAVGYL